MRRRSRNMRHPTRVQPRHVIGEGFARLRQHHRAAADDGAQENLQAAIAADVVEGGPDRRRAARRAVARRWRRSIPPAYGRRSSARPRCPRSASAIRSRVRSARSFRRQPAGPPPARARCRDPPSAPAGRSPPHRFRHPRSGCRDASGLRSGGHSSMRRATPSISIMASAEINWPDTASSTERPESSAPRPPRQLCDRISVSDTLCRASEMVRPVSSGPR